MEIFRNQFVQVLKDAQHPVATVWLCREEKRNALGAPVLAAIECVPLFISRIRCVCEALGVLCLMTAASNCLATDRRLLRCRHDR